MKVINAPFCELLAAFMFHTGQPEFSMTIEEMAQFRATLGDGAGVKVEFKDGVTKLELLNGAEMREWRGGAPVKGCGGCGKSKGVENG